MLHIVNISESDYEAYIYNQKRYFVVPEDSGIVKHDYLVMRWNDNSIIFYVNFIDDLICSLIPCHVEIDEVSYVSIIENNENDDDFYALPFS